MHQLQDIVFTKAVSIYIFSSQIYYIIQLQNVRACVFPLTLCKIETWYECFVT